MTQWRSWLPRVALVLCATGAAVAQTLPDLQPGRNFTSAANFGADSSDKLAPGDVDNDGDLDVAVANGIDGALQFSRIFINLGGLQGGAVGTFAEETATRFAGFPLNTSRDLEFCDVDADGDLDAGVASDGNQGNGGRTGRFYTNRGGLQGGTVGFFQDDTDLRWGQLVSVPLSQQLYGGNHGPFREYSCDCEFADLDDDGDSDLFYSSYGPAISGNRDSRIFLNDGNGIFDELYPWADPAANIQTRSHEFDLVDLDGDFDIDVALSNRTAQARTYMNNSVNGIGPTLFQDITQAAFIAPGATASGVVSYEVEPADVDGDGDFDLWFDNYNNNTDRLLRNDGFVPGVGYSFTRMDAWIKGDPNQNDEHIAFSDYDGDGDLDGFVANFGGTNFLFQNVLAQGLAFDSVGLMHRTGTTAGGSLAPTPELPSSFNGGTSDDGGSADVDNDGDEDLLLGNGGNQQNYLFRNVRGVPDTHAPTFYKLTQQPDKPNGSASVVHAQIRDNTNLLLAAYEPATLVYSVNGAAPVSVPMFSQGSMQYRAVIPAQTDALIAWHVEVSDLAGNEAFSETRCFAQGVSPGPWFDLGGGLAGSLGVPQLSGTGTLAAGTPGSLDLTAANPSSSLLLFVSLASVPVPFKGGTIAAAPWIVALPLATDVSGALSLVWASWPAGLPPCTNLYFQYAVADGGAVQGVALSNALHGVSP